MSLIIIIKLNINQHMDMLYVFIFNSKKWTLIQRMLNNRLKSHIIGIVKIGIRL